MIIFTKRPANAPPTHAERLTKALRDRREEGLSEPPPLRPKTWADMSTVEKLVTAKRG